MRILASIYDVRKMFLIFRPPLSLSQISWFCSFCLLLGDPPPPNPLRTSYMEAPYHGHFCRTLPSFPAYLSVVSSSSFTRHAKTRHLTSPPSLLATCPSCDTHSICLSVWGPIQLLFRVSCWEGLSEGFSKWQAKNASKNPSENPSEFRKSNRIDPLNVWSRMFAAADGDLNSFWLIKTAVFMHGCHMCPMGHDSVFGYAWNMCSVHHFI